MTEMRTERRPQPEDSCIAAAVLGELSTDPQLKAVSIDRAQGRVSVAALGRQADPAVAERIAESIERVQRQGVGEPCRFLESDGACDGCELAPDPLRRGGFTITQEGGSTTIARVSCPTAPRLWRWRQFTLPRIIPRQVVVPEREEELEEWKLQALAAGLCGVLGVMAWVLSGTVWALPLHVAAYVAGAWFAAEEVWEGLRSRTLDVHFLMLTVAVGSAAVGAWEEGTTLLFLFSTSGALEHYAMGRTQREIRALFRAAPKVAILLDAQGREHEVAVDMLRPGQRLLVKPGAQFPVDAEVVKGRTASDESNLTGEATPVEKGVGDTVLAGTMNLWGVVEASVLRPVQESALERIIRMIREAQHLKAPSQRFTDRFGTGYTYGILGLSLGMFLVWWQGMSLPAFSSEEGVRSAFYRTMTLLVVASPCALVLSIPSAILAAIAWGARRGILFRGGGAVERLSEVDVVALDKTGTLTTGELGVEGVASFPPGREPEVARLAFSMERLSTHPLARAITRYGKQAGLAALELDHFESVTGLGIRARMRGREVWLGRREWLEEVLRGEARFAAAAASAGHVDPGHSEVWVWDGDLLGRVLLRDAMREQSRSVVEGLRAMGMRTVVLTGDRAGAARALQAALGLDDVRAELKPEDKVQAIRELTASGRRVAMVGDGVNDAPSLAVAHVGVAMGARGSDAALEQAEIVLMHDRLENVMAALRLSQRARRVIQQNLVVSLGTVAVLVGFAIAGQIPLTLGVVGHEGSTVIVVLNSLRLLFLGGGSPTGMASSVASSQPAASGLPSRDGSA